MTSAPLGSASVRSLLSEFTDSENQLQETDRATLSALLDRIADGEIDGLDQEQSAYFSLFELLGVGANHTLEIEEARLESLLNSQHRALLKLRASQSVSSPDIDIIGLTGFAEDENTHSRFLRFFLDPEEAHAQRSLFLRLLLEQAGLPVEYANREYWGRCEVCTKLSEGDVSRIDIEVACGGPTGFLIHIESKVRDVPAKAQLDKENRALELRGRQLGVPLDRIHGFLLTPRTKDAGVASGHFTFLHWQNLSLILERFAREARAPRARFAAEQYRKCVSCHVLRSTEDDSDTKNGGKCEVR
jgi:hypothetical protein